MRGSACRCPMRGSTSQTAAPAASRAEIGPSASAGEETGSTASAGRPAAGNVGMSGEARERALAEIAFCDSVLAKSGLNILTETFRDSQGVVAWEHYPPGDVFDPATGSQWFYHCHPAEEGVAEHGHFHCFVRPQGIAGPIHHLAAVGVDAYGRPLRLFTVNQWVVGDDWLDAEATIALLPRFDMQMPRPSYLVNRWLTAIFVAHDVQIAALIRQRDETLAAHRGAEGVSVREDRALEVTSELRLA